MEYFRTHHDSIERPEQSRRTALIPTKISHSIGPARLDTTQKIVDRKKGFTPFLESSHTKDSSRKMKKRGGEKPRMNDPVYLLLRNIRKP